MIPLRFLARRSLAPASWRGPLATVLATAALGLALQVQPLRAATDAEAQPTVAQRSAAYGDFLAGVVAEQRRDTGAAADFYLKTLRADPGNDALLERTFLLLSVEGRLDDAVPLAEQVVEKAPKHQLARFVLTVAALRKSDFAAARKQLADVGQRGPARIAEPLIQAWLAAEAKDKAGVAKALGDLTGLDKLTGRLAVHEGLIEEKLGDAAAADADMKTAAGDTKATSFWLLRVVENYFLRHGQPAEAKAVAESFAKQSDSVSLNALMQQGLESKTPPAPLISTTRQGIATVLFDLGQILSGEESSDAPLFYAHLALWLEPGLDEAKVLVGELLQRQGRSTAAIAAYRQIPESSPYHWSIGLRIAGELENLKHDDEAAALLEKLAADRPDRFEPYYELGNLYRAGEQFDKAAQAYDKAVERLGRENTPWTLFYFRGIALERTGHWDRAEADFKKALELQPEQPYVLNYLAYSWIEQGRNLDEAQKMLERAVKAKPDDGYIVDSLGWVYYRLKQYKKAAETLEKAIELKPGDPVINDHLGDAYWRNGRKREARVQWRRALSLEPEAEEIPKIEKKLDQGLPADPQNI
ncbi:Tetratricopeptide repeat-containing protein [Tistlia consotensis]|uniref:Tetratricopeptide repeat-containing protein n=1 Tax=Tistlia consotensis USBA 355 TaxID=560819 RepID=A0A1Y6C2Y2_9PROT|nr:tetratricopeptide repeat protein [Tistlia consotensis]SMF38991.1 Tetratricopeptide repeat-containing protein [Tistlia consotensis USBA 355]SNR36626.1 Tetratricopeptide repeat-containing protein [Tistlia consotensis]